MGISKRTIEQAAIEMTGHQAGQAFGKAVAQVTNAVLAGKRLPERFYTQARAIMAGDSVSASLPTGRHQAGMI